MRGFRSSEKGKDPPRTSKSNDTCSIHTSYTRLRISLHSDPGYTSFIIPVSRYRIDSENTCLNNQKTSYVNPQRPKNNATVCSLHFPQSDSHWAHAEKQDKLTLSAMKTAYISRLKLRMSCSFPIFYPEDRTRSISGGFGNNLEWLFIDFHDFAIFGGSGSKLPSVNTQTIQFSPFLDSRSLEKTCVYIYVYEYVYVYVYYIYICM